MVAYELCSYEFSLVVALLALHTYCAFYICIFVAFDVMDWMCNLSASVSDYCPCESLHAFKETCVDAFNQIDKFKDNCYKYGVLRRV